MVYTGLRSLRKFSVATLIIGAIFLFVLWCIREDFTLKGSNHMRTDKTAAKKTILFGTGWWHSHYPFIKEAEKHCPRCNFIENRKKFTESDAVIFHSTTVNPKKPPVKKRSRSQIWIWMSFETPDFVGSSVRRTTMYADMFNWTMTYRRDSDVVVPYGRFISFEEMALPEYEETWAFMPSALPNKEGIYDDSFTRIPTLDEIKGRRLVAWIVSHCHTASKRELIAKELSKYVPVDIYGKCGNFTCDVPKWKAMSGIDCRFQISRKYKFYLAFENSLCEDYITEKFFDVLYTQMVPVVYGGAKYSAIAPKNSYINVADFKTVENLAVYLKFLDSHPEEYLKYFEWRKTHWVQNNRFVTGYCSVCDKLWQDIPPKTYHNLTDWWYHRGNLKTPKRNACFRPNFVSHN